MVVRLHHSLHPTMVGNPHLLRVRKSDYYYATRAHCSLVALHKILCAGRDGVLGSQLVLQKCLQLIDVHMPDIEPKVAVLGSMSGKPATAAGVQERLCFPRCVNVHRDSHI